MTFAQNLWVLPLIIIAPAALDQPWKHAVIEPKGDAGFMLTFGQRDFASKHE